MQPAKKMASYERHGVEKATEAIELINTTLYERVRSLLAVNSPTHVPTPNRYVPSRQQIDHKVPLGSDPKIGVYIWPTP